MSTLTVLALTFRLPRGAGGVTEAVAADAFPDCECPAEPPCRGGRRRSNLGKGVSRWRMAGTVKFFNGERGYGFIKPDDGGRDVFVHITAVERAGLEVAERRSAHQLRCRARQEGQGPEGGQPGHHRLSARADPGKRRHRFSAPDMRERQSEMTFPRIVTRFSLWWSMIFEFPNAAREMTMPGFDAGTGTAHGFSGSALLFRTIT